MEELSPIRTIKANFGRPIRLTCPNADAFVERLSKEVMEAEDNPYDAFLLDTAIWESAITQEQRKTFEELSKRKKEAEKAYNPKIHNVDSKEAQAFFKASDELERFEDASGKHLCFRCSYYLTAKTKSGAMVTFCDRTDNKKAVRPYSLACKHFTTGVTEQVLKAEKDYEEACRKNPRFASYARKHQREDAAKRFADYIDNSPSTAFFMYQGAPDYYEKLYTDYPLILAQTKYPSFPLFLEAYTRWEKEVTIKRETGKDGSVGYTLTVSNKEFCPPDTPLPPTSTPTSDN